MASEDDKEYNVYNEFDSNFVNYGELYKSPMEMKKNSKELINDYADALIKGGVSTVYKDSPNLVGNRYFISTNSKCLDNDDKEQTRSILVDNVNASAMEKAEDGNKGLIYSLLASLKTINSGDMFNEMKDGHPTENINDNKDYLNDTELPKCDEIKVFANDKKEKTVSGWVTNNDRPEIDPKSIKEGFKEGLNTFMSHITSDAKPGEFGEQAAKSLVAAEADTEAIIDESKKAQAETISAANKAQAQGKKAATESQKNSSKMTEDNIKSQNEAGKKNVAKARQNFLNKQLKTEARKFINENKSKDILFFLKELLNTHYDCTGEIIQDKEKKTYESNTDNKQDRYAHYKLLLDMGIDKGAIYKKMKDENLDPTVVIPEGISYGKGGIKEDDDDTSKTIRIPAKCVYAIYKESPRKEVEHIFAEMINLINKNKTNSKVLEVPGIPKINNQHRIFGGSSGVSNRQTDIMKNLDKYRLKIAMEIIRYRDIDTYGHCGSIKSTEGFSTFDNSSYSSYSSNMFISWTSSLYMISLLFIIVFIIYKVMIRLLFKK